MKHFHTSKLPLRRFLWLRNLNTVIVLFGCILVGSVWLVLLDRIHNDQTTEINNAIKDTTNFARAFEEHTLRTIKSVDQTGAFLEISL